MLTRTYIFDNYVDAKAAVLALEDAGIAPHFTTIMGRGDEDIISLAEFAPGKRLSAVRSGGVLSALGLLVLPGIGLLAAGGWLPAGLMARGVTGEAIIETLTEAGHSSDDAQILAEALHRGASLVGLRCDAGRVDRLEELLGDLGGVEPALRGAAYAEGGWTRFDPEAVPYTSEEVYNERRRYVRKEGISYRHAA